MNPSKAPWQRTFLEFAGHGIRRPSDMMRVKDWEAQSFLAELADLEWQAPLYEGVGRHAGYAVRNAAYTCSTGLFRNGVLVGFYAGPYLWMGKEHRGRGLATPLILLAARQRGGSVLPPGDVLLGYTAAGVAAHRVAHRHAVLTALAEGLPVPPAVLHGLRLQEGGLRSDPGLSAGRMAALSARRPQVRL